jgi:hypothetical protein
MSRVIIGAVVADRGGEFHEMGFVVLVFAVHVVEHVHDVVEVESDWVDRAQSHHLPIP